MSRRRSRRIETNIRGFGTLRTQPPDIIDEPPLSSATGIQGSRDAFRMAISRELIDEDELWMDMLQSRQKTSHTYDEKIADEIVDKILKYYFNLFKKFFDTFISIENNFA